VWGEFSGGPYPSETTPQEMTATGAFTAVLGSLVSDTTYYFRSKVTGSATYYGNELILTTLPSTYEISLYSGWNLISLPLIPDSSNIEDVLAGIEGNVISVWAYDAETENWRLCAPPLDTIVDQGQLQLM